MRSPLLPLILGAATCVSAIDYAAMLDEFWGPADVDGDKELSYAEFLVAADDLGLEASGWINHGKSHQNFFNAYDTNGNKKLSQKEFAAVASDKTYSKLIISAFTNGAGEVPTISPTPDKAITEAKAVVKFLMSVAGTPGAIKPGKRKKLRKFFADKAGVTTEAVLMTFVSKAEGRRLEEHGRKLAASTEIEAKMFVKDNTAADAARAQLSDTDALKADPAFDRMTVEEISPPQATSDWELPVPLLAIAVVLLIVLCVFSCFAAKFIAGKGRAKYEEAFTTCCKNGCCSFFAVKSWAASNLLACLLTLLFVIYLSTVMNALTAAIMGLIEAFLGIVNSNVSFVKSFSGMIPPDIPALLDAQKANVALIPVATMVPGLLAVVCVFFVGACPMGKCHQGKYGCTKCFVLLSFVLLLLALIFYCIFMGIALVLEFAPPAVQDQINSITKTCEVLPAQLTQLVTDNSITVGQLKKAGQDVSELEKTLNEIGELVEILDGGCGNLLKMFQALVDLFVPAFFCVICILYAFYTTQSFCCAAGGCCEDNVKRRVAQESGVPYSATKSDDKEMAAP